jgi:2,4-dienoyl-CoA reductase-like NADH-dependent reductase (Old Yellow Enzyme family)
MAMTLPETPLSFLRGHAMPNRVALAPLTNTQSHPDGTLSEEEYRWLTLRAGGGFGLTMTCASHVAAQGQGFPGQLGCFDERHAEGLGRLASAIKAQGGLAWIQLHHAGMRSPSELIGQAPLSASDDAETGARAMREDEIEAAIAAFIAAAQRGQAAGFDGAQVHGAHGYLVAQFLSPQTNRRSDSWGGDLAGRSRFLRAILAGVRAACGPLFQLGVRLSPERFGLRLEEMRELAAALMAEGHIDMLDLSLWDYRKAPETPLFEGRTLLAHFTDLPRQGVALFGAGKIASGADVRAALAAGLDGVMMGRAAIVHHDAAARALADPGFTPTPLPVSVSHLQAEGLGAAFIEYMRNWKGFVAD